MSETPLSRRRGLTAYLRNHWQGRQSLAWSFWVNLVGLRAAILGLGHFTRPPYIEDPTALAVVTVAFFVVFHLVVFAWQIVGVVRACDVHQSSFGASSLPLVVYVGIACSVAVTLSPAYSAFLLLNREPPGEPDFLAWERERAARYSLAPDAGNALLLRFSGTFELGVTKKLTALLSEGPAFGGIVFDSPGGHVYEGRGVARLVLRHGLDTYVTGSCSSACTTAFIAGRERVLGPEGRLGFHQHSLDADYPVYLADEEGEMQKDLDFYAARGIAPDFLERVFVTPHDGLWFPSAEEMLAAGVVTRLGLPPE